MSSQRFGQRLSTFDLLQQVLNNAAESGLGRKFSRDAETAIQRQSSFDKRREFFGEEENVFLRDAFEVKTAPLQLHRRLFDRQRDQAHALNSQRNGALIRT